MKTRHARQIRKGVVAFQAVERSRKLAIETATGGIDLWQHLWEVVKLAPQPRPRAFWPDGGLEYHAYYESRERAHKRREATQRKVWDALLD